MHSFVVSVGREGGGGGKREEEDEEEEEGEKEVNFLNLSGKYQIHPSVHIRALSIGMGPYAK